LFSLSTIFGELGPYILELISIKCKTTRDKIHDK
jgi:hypothetical protein